MRRSSEENVSVFTAENLKLETFETAGVKVAFEIQLLKDGEMVGKIVRNEVEIAA